MIVAAQLGFQDYGKKIPKWRDGLRNEEVTVGLFGFRHERVKAYNSVCAVADLRNERNEVIMQLLRAEMIYAKDEYIVVTGIEHDPIRGRYTAQTWCMKVLAPAWSGLTLAKRGDMRQMPGP